LSATNGVLTGLLIVSTSVWVGGLVAIAIVARVASRTLDTAERVSFFRALGRSYGIVGTAALLLAYATGAALLRDHHWGPALTAVVVVGAALAVTLGAGTVQARRMTRLRRTALDRTDDTALAARVRRGALGAHVIRGLIGLLSLALVALGVLMAS
jgi:hypothetical protein